MSDTTASLRRKLNSAGDLRSIVRTMKALAASTIGQYEQSVRALANYYRTVELSTPFHKYSYVFGVRKLACALIRSSLLRRGNALEASFALSKRQQAAALQMGLEYVVRTCEAEH